VSEIVRNAHQYAGGGRVEFGIVSSSRPQALFIRVSDNGPGIADLDAVLSGRHRSTTGMGLGLVGSQRLMDSLVIHSRPGDGTTVECSKTLPAEAPALDSSDIAAIGAGLTQPRAGVVSEI
jgi:anti-sigma regulatory factor (Ser/Thr protein kinase)